MGNYLSTYIFPIASAIVLVLIGLIILHLNSTFIGSKIITTNTILILMGIWFLMLWINYGTMTLATVLKIIMVIVLMITVYLFILFEMAGKNCSQDMNIWSMIKSIL